MTHNIQNLIEHFQIFSKSSKKTNIRDIREVTTHYQLKGSEQERPLDFSAIFESVQK